MYVVGGSPKFTFFIIFFLFLSALEFSVFRFNLDHLLLDFFDSLHLVLDQLVIIIFLITIKILVNVHSHPILLVLFDQFVIVVAIIQFSDVGHTFYKYGVDGVAVVVAADNVLFVSLVDWFHEG